MAEFVPPGTRWFALPTPFPAKRGGALDDARLAYEPGPARRRRLQRHPDPQWDVARRARGFRRGRSRARLVGVDDRPRQAHRHPPLVRGLLERAGQLQGQHRPGSVDPATGAPYRLEFPALSIEDGADAAAALLRGLGIRRLACVVGNSMGGMSALALLARHPGIARSHINICGAARALPFSIAIRSLQREAIRLDPHWNGGDYDDADNYPENGRWMARKLFGVVTYCSALEWDGRFGRVRLDSEQREDDEPFGLEFEVERYLEAHARRFVHRYDPNCYLYLSRSMDWFDLGEDHAGDTARGLAAISGLSARW